MEELRTLTAVERKMILDEYDQSWSEADAGYIYFQDALAKCRSTDHLGFMHDHELPALSPKEVKESIREHKRAGKWVKMMNNWKKYGASAKMRRRVYKGIPMRVRGQAWALLLNVPQMKAKNAGVYERLKEQGRCQSPYIEQINLEVSRTFQEHIFYYERYSTKQQALFHVLLAYSMFKSDVGYWPGLNTIAALLLIFMDEEEAFWSLVQLMGNRKHGMKVWFRSYLPKLHQMTKHLAQVLSKLDANLRQHLSQETLMLVEYMAMRFFRRFKNQALFGFTLRFWDLFILHGPQVMTGIALSILQVNQIQLLQLSGDEQLNFILHCLRQPWGLSEDEVLSRLQTIMDHVSKLKMDLPPLEKKKSGPRPRDKVPKPRKVRRLPATADSHSLSTESQSDFPVPFGHLDDSDVESPFLPVRRSLPPRAPVIPTSVSSVHVDNWEPKMKSRCDRELPLCMGVPSSDPCICIEQVQPVDSLCILKELRQDSLPRAPSQSSGSYATECFDTQSSQLTEGQTQPGYFTEARRCLSEGNLDTLGAEMKTQGDTAICIGTACSEPLLCKEPTLPWDSCPRIMTLKQDGLSRPTSLSSVSNATEWFEAQSFQVREGLPPLGFFPAIRRVLSMGYLDSWEPNKKTRRDRSMSLQIRGAASDPSLLQKSTESAQSTKMLMAPLQDSLQGAQSLNTLSPPTVGLESSGPELPQCQAQMGIFSNGRRALPMGHLTYKAKCSMRRVASF